MNPIVDSILDIFKIGPGPSSSHTIGPMRMANDFIARHSAARRIEVDFYGSMALTGRGHGSDRAIVAGFLGDVPERCDTVRLNRLALDKSNCFHEDAWQIQFYFHPEPHDFPCANTVVIREAGKSHGVTYYSVGGGFIEVAGELPRESGVPGQLPPCRYRNLDTFQKMLVKHGLSLPDAVLANERFLHPELDMPSELDRRLDAMLQSVERGLQASGKLPGALGVSRRAATVHAAAVQRREADQGENLLFIDAYALAAAEENAAGSLVVTAPTSGSAGLLPGLVYFLKHHEAAPPEQLREGLLAAGLIGLVARRNASIAGAEVGCQGEIGVASAMGAAFLCQTHGLDARTVECAAEIALEHHLGLSCDPVGGYVQIPCIERNAAGAVAAYNAFLLAGTGSADSSLVSFDEVLAAMLETGRAMANAYKETSLGGLANCACCS